MYRRKLFQLLGAALALASIPVKFISSLEAFSARPKWWSGKVNWVSYGLSSAEEAERRKFNALIRAGAADGEYALIEPAIFTGVNDYYMDSVHPFHGPSEAAGSDDEIL